MAFEKKQIAGIDCLIQNGAPKAQTVILLHGYGASSQDLAPLSDVLGISNANWVFPNGILEVPLGLMMTGRAWFPIDIQGLEKAMANNDFRDFTLQTPAGMREAADKIKGIITQLGKPPEEIILGGFSQGAMLACEVALTAKENFQSLILWSTAFIDENRWKPLIEAKKELKVFQSHGKQDPMLSFSQAQELSVEFQKNLSHYQWVPFDGGHEINPLVIQKLGQFLK